MKTFMLTSMKISPAVAKKTLLQIWESGADSNNNEKDSHILYIRETRLLLKLGKISDCWERSFFWRNQLVSQTFKGERWSSTFGYSQLFLSFQNPSIFSQEKSQNITLSKQNNIFQIRKPGNTLT